MLSILSGYVKPGEFYFEQRFVIYASLPIFIGQILERVEWNRPEFDECVSVTKTKQIMPFNRIRAWLKRHNWSKNIYESWAEY